MSNLYLLSFQDHYWDGEELSGHGKAYKSISLGEEMKLNIM